MQVVLFDVDGTLIRGEGTGRKALEQAFTITFGVENVAAMTRGVRFSGVLDPVIHDDMARLLEIDPDLLARRRRDLVDTYLVHLLRECRRDGVSHVLPGVRELLDRLRAHPDVHLGLITGNIEAGARIKLQGHGLNGYFARGGFGQDAPTRAGVARVALARVLEGVRETVNPGEVTIIGDSELDVECGRSNGFRTLAVSTGWTSPEDLEAAEPDHLLADLGATDHVLEILGVAGKTHQ